MLPRLTFYVEWSLKNDNIILPMTSRIVIATIGITLCLIFFACAQKKAAPRQFYYYPDLNLYFDVAANNYLYSLDGAVTWDSIHAEASNFSTHLGDKILITADTDSIWKDNTRHRDKYGGYIYNIMIDDSTDTSGKDVVTEREIVKKKGSVVKKDEEKIKERKGLGKLLNRIFGKKKAKNKETEVQ